MWTQQPDVLLFIYLFISLFILSAPREELYLSSHDCVDCQVASSGLVSSFFGF